MREILPPELPHIERYYHYRQLFSPPECAQLRALADAQAMQPGTIGIGQGQQPVIDEDYRCVRTARVLPEEAPWAFEKLKRYTQYVNHEYRFDLSGLYEDIGIMRYDAGSEEKKPGRYQWHQDFGGGPYSRRKISIVALLSDPGDFEGGELRMFTQCDERVSLNEQGDTVFFPAWAPHCVTDVTKGVRYSLVAWVSGPRFR
jgi:PKHD-type hydroxylase